MGAMLDSMQLSDAQTLSMSKNLTALSGDMASFYNLTGEEAFNKIRAGIAGEIEPLRQLGINMSIANLENYALTQGITKSYKAMTQGEQAILRYNYLLSVTANAQGDFIRTQDGWANQTRILSERFDELKIIVGNILIYVLTPFLQVLNKGISILLSFSKALANVLGIENVISSAGSAASSIESITNNENDLTSSVENTTEALKEQNKMLAGFDKLNDISKTSASSLPTGKESSSTSMNVNSYFEDVEPISSDSFKITESDLDVLKEKIADICQNTGIDTFWNKFLISLSGVKNSVLNLWEYFKTAISENKVNLTDMANSISGAFSTVFTTLSTIYGDYFSIFTQEFNLFTIESEDTITTFFSSFIGTVSEATAVASDVINGLYSSILSWWNNGGSTVFSYLISAIMDVCTWLLKIWNNTISPTLDRVSEKTKELWEENLQPLWEDLLALITSVGNFFNLIWTKLFKPIVDWLLAILLPTIKDIANSVTEVAAFVISFISTKVQLIIKVLKTIISFITNIFTKGWSEAWNTLKDDVVAIWEFIKEKVFDNIKKILNIALSGIETFANSIIRVINGIVKAINLISFDIPDWVPGIGGRKFGFNISTVKEIQIPRLATGAVIPARSEFVAVLGDQKHGRNLEAPEGLIRQIVREESSRLTYEDIKTAFYAALLLAKENGVLDFDVNMDARKVGQMTAKHVGNEFNRSGFVLRTAKG